MTPRPALVPVAVHAEFDELVDRAANVGRVLWDRPLLEAAQRRTQGCKAMPRPEGEVTRIRLSHEVLALPTAERRWTLAHELAHVLRYQAGEHIGHSRFQAAVLVVLAALWLNCGVLLLLRNAAGQPFLPVSAAALVLMLVVAATGVLVLTAPIRAEEAATDQLAAAVLGEVLTPAGVERLRRHERIGRLVPSVFPTPRIGELSALPPAATVKAEWEGASW